MDANIAVTQFTAAAVFVWAMQRVKASPWIPFIKNEGQVWLKRGASIVTAIGVHTGISHIWNPTPSVQGGGWDLMIHIPPVMVIATELWHWLGQYAMQETLYQAVANKNVAAAPPKP
jgi:hypothetical protein